MPYRLQKNINQIGHGRAYEIKRIRDMAEGEKPREKKIKKGVRPLRLGELLAVVLGVRH